MAAQVAASGYDIKILQTSSGEFVGRFEIREDNDNIFLVFQVNVAVQLIGHRNMKVTAFCTFTNGHGIWRGVEVENPFLAGYNLSDTTVCCRLKADTTMVCALFSREKFMLKALPRTLDLLHHTNNATVDGVLQRQWCEEVWNRMHGWKNHSLYELTNTMLNTAVGTVPDDTTLAEKTILESLPPLIDRIFAGENILVADAQDMASCSASTYSKGIVDFLGIKPKALIDSAKTELLLTFINSRIARRKHGMGDSFRLWAQYVHWSENTARRAVKKMTTRSVKQLLADR